VVDVEEVHPEVDQHLVELPFAVDGPQERRLLQLVLRRALTHLGPPALDLPFRQRRDLVAHQGG